MWVGFSWNSSSLFHTLSLGPSIGAGVIHFQMAHSHGWQVGVGCWFGAQQVCAPGALVPVTRTSLWTSWAPTQHGSWVPRTSIPREQSRSAWHFYKLDSEVTYHPFCHSLLFETVTKFMGEKTWTPFNGRDARSHCKKSKWGRRYVVSIFGKYNLPKLV